MSVGDLPEVRERTKEVEELFVKYADRFIKDGDQLQPFSNVPPIHYRLKPDVKSYPRAKYRRWSEQEAAVLMKYKEDNANYLENSQSPSSCLPLLVKKKDGRWRVVVNFIPVNKIVAPFAWPLPGMDMSYRRLLWAEWFSYWDFCSGYHQSPLREDWRWLTATVFPDGSLMQWMVGPQGFIDTGQWFTYHVHLICNDPLLKKYISHYVDDGHMGTKTFDEHLTMLDHFFRKLEYHTASLAGKKSGFFVKTFKLLGLIITHDKVYADTEKLKKCEGFKTPMTPSEMKGFIHFVGFYQMKIPEYSLLCKNLHGLIKKAKGNTAKFQEEWKKDPIYRESYETLRKAMYSSRVLRRFDKSKPLILATDASEGVISYVLAHPEAEDVTVIHSQLIYFPIVFGGRTLTDTESRYTIPEKEVLAIVEAIRKLMHFVRDVKLHVFTDHAAVLNYVNGVSVNKRIIRMLLTIADIDIEWYHRKREFGTDVDGLTRLEWPEQKDELLMDVIDESEPGEDLNAIKPHPHYSIYALISDDELRQLNALERTDERYYQIYLCLSGKSLAEFDVETRKRIRRESVKYFLSDKNLYRRAIHRPRLYVKPSMRIRMMKNWHGSAEFGHMGVTTTFKAMRVRYYWPTLYSDIKEMIKTCNACQQWSNRPTLKYQLYRIPPPARFGVIIGMDFVNGLPGIYKNMLSFIDYGTSWVESWPCQKTSSAFVVKCLKEWRHRYGCPEQIITDNGSEFRGYEMGIAADQYKIQMTYASVAYAKTNGKVEKYQGILTKLISKSISDSGDRATNWQAHLTRAVWTWRIQPKGDLGTSPYVAVFGQEPRIIPDGNSDLLNETLMTEEELKDIWNADHSYFADCVRKDMRRKALRQAQDAPELPPPRVYKEGDLVYLWDKRLDDQHGRKLDPIWKGPYYVKAAHPNGSYAIEDLDGNRVSSGKTYNHSHLKPAFRPVTLEEVLA